MCCMRLTENAGCTSNAKICHLCTITQRCWAISLQLRHVLTIWKRVKQQYLFRMSSHYSELRSTNGLRVWGTPGNFNGFHILASLLHRCCATDVNQTLHDIWPSPGLTGPVTLCIHFRGLLPPTEFFQVQNSLCVQFLRSPILPALLHGTRAVASAKLLCDVVQGIELRNFHSSFSLPGMKAF